MKEGTRSKKEKELIETIEDTRNTKIKVRNLALLVKNIFDDEFDENDEEVAYVAMRDVFDEDEKCEKSTLFSHIRKNDRWIIYSEYSHHITGDTSKFES